MLGNRTRGDECRVCANRDGNELHSAREMLYGRRDPFTYVECANCRTLQIREVPDLGPYYSGDYYSFRPSEDQQEVSGLRLMKRISRRAGAAARRRAAAYYCNRRRALGELRYPAGRYIVEKMRRVVVGFPEYLMNTRLHLGLRPKSAILDVGTGAGGTLIALSHFGFRNLTGVDPFLEAGAEYPNGVRVLRADLSDLGGRYDLILANHSLEHVPDPRRTLGEIRRLLKPGRYAIVRIPVVAHAWQKYKTYWVQLDPPRHLFIFTAGTFKTLAESAGFEVGDVVYDSTAFQFWGSEQYLQDIPMMDERSYFVNPEKSLFSPAQIADFNRRARELNAAADGDQAIFYLRKTSP
jgi:SAM-dependent methyltransferase